MLPVESHGVGHAGSGHGLYGSAVLVTPAFPLPPATRTRPSVSTADMARYRSVLMLATGDHEPVEVSKISASPRYPVPSTPPETSTRPSGSRSVSAKNR